MSIASTLEPDMNMLEHGIAFRSADVDETHLYAKELISDHRLFVSGRGFETRINHFDGIDVNFIHMSFRATVLVDPDKIDDCFLLHIPLKGHSLLHHQSAECRLSPARAGITSAEIPFRITWTPECIKLIVLLRRQKVAKVCRNFVGKGYRAPLQLAPEMDLQNKAGAALFNLLSYGLTLSSLPLHQRRLTQGRYEEMLVTHLLTCQQHNYMDFLERDNSGGVAPRCVKMAEQYIEDNICMPLTLSDIAEHCGVTVRTLTRSFRSFRCRTPMEFLRERRLDQARAELQSGTAQTVAQTAYGWGFTHLGRFAKMYQERFGELPSETAGPHSIRNH